MQAKKRSMQIIAACGLLSAVWVSSMTAAGKPSPSTPLATFWFENELSGVPLDVSGDNLGVYKDYRLTSGDDINDVNYCVEASPSSTLLFIRLNRNLDGDSGIQSCQHISGRTQAQRDMTLHISSGSACAELLANAPAGYAVADAPPTVGCTFGHFARPRIRISSDIYAKRTTSTAVDFLEKSYEDADISYEVQSDTNAAVIVDLGDPARRTVRSVAGATAHLVKFVPGTKSVPAGDWSSPFPLSFSIVVVKAN